MSGGPAKPPPFYICNRCEQPGHWKKDCPTLGDAAYDQKKFSVGIPVSRTKVITEEEAANSTEGVMRLPDGRLVQCMPSVYVQRIVVALSLYVVGSVSGLANEHSVAARFPTSSRMGAIARTLDSRARFDPSRTQHEAGFQYSALFLRVHRALSRVICFTAVYLLHCCLCLCVCHVHVACSENGWTSCQLVQKRMWSQHACFSPCVVGADVANLWIDAAAD